MRSSDKVTLQIGKNGLGEGQYTEIIKNLRANKEVRVKFLKSFIEDKNRKEIAEKIKEELSQKSKMQTEVKLIGNVLLFRRKNL